MDKYTVVNAFSRILSTLKEGNSITDHNMEKPWIHYNKWNKPVTKEEAL